MHIVCTFLQVTMTREELGYHPYTVTGHAVRAFDLSNSPIACWILDIPVNDLHAPVEVSVSGNAILSKYLGIDTTFLGLEMNAFTDAHVHTTPHQTPATSTRTHARTHTYMYSVTSFLPTTPSAIERKRIEFDYHGHRDRFVQRQRSACDGTPADDTLL